MAYNGLTPKQAYKSRLHQKEKHRTQLNGLNGSKFSITHPYGSKMNKNANINPMLLTNIQSL